MTYLHRLAPLVALASALGLGPFSPPGVSAGIVGFGGDGTGYTLNGNAAGSATVASDVLTVTDGSSFQASSAFFNTPQSISEFNASFIYQASGQRASDGVAFVLQNDSAGASALGGMGGQLGYAYMGPSAAIEFNLYTYYGVGTNFRTNGQTYQYNPTGSVDISGGDPILVELIYNGTTLSETLTDLTTHATYSTSYTTDLTSVLGAGTAYVGFTGGTGGTSAIQTISDFRFNTGTVPEPGSIVLMGVGLLGVCGVACVRRKKGIVAGSAA